MDHDESSSPGYHPWVLFRVGIACAVAACYEPRDLLPCTLTCTTPGSSAGCPDGQTCGDDLRCFATTQCSLDGGTSCFGHWLLKPCIPSNAAPLDLSGTLDTSTDPRCVDTEQASGSTTCMVFGSDVSIGDLRVDGLRPLVIVATHDLVVTGTLDAATHVGPGNPAGPHALAVSSMCEGGEDGLADIASASGGGGAGGSLQGRGGGGGNGTGTATGGKAQIGIAPGDVVSLRAGCPGTSGGGPSGSAGALGGGAVYLIAGNRIDVQGRINASGAGASPPKNSGGGGGGGAGGMIVLDAPMIAVTGTLLAFGGSGASGSAMGVDGVAGADPGLDATAAPGAIAPQGAGNGGAGCDTIDGGLGGPASTMPAGGGGGGGGCGYIVMSPSLAPPGGTIAPSPIVKP